MKETWCLFMLTEIYLRNFKAFGKKGSRIPCKPITLIFGENSSGKSSILKSLLALKQTIEDNDPNNVLLHQGTYVDIGPFEEIVFGHDTRKRVEIGLQWRSSDYLHISPYKERIFKKFKINLTYISKKIEERPYILLDKIIWGISRNYGKKIEKSLISAKLVYCKTENSRIYQRIKYTCSLSKISTERVIPMILLPFLRESISGGYKKITIVENIDTPFIISYSAYEEKFKIDVFDIEEKIEKKIHFDNDKIPTINIKVPIETILKIYQENSQAKKIEIKNIVEKIRRELEKNKFFLLKKDKIIEKICKKVEIGLNEIKDDILIDHDFRILIEESINMKIEKLFRIIMFKDPSEIETDLINKLIKFIHHNLSIEFVGNPIKGELLKINTFFKLEHGKKNLYFDYDVTEENRNQFIELMKSITFIGPLRDKPSRYYIFGGSRPINVGVSGSKTADFIYSYKNKINELNNWLKKLKIGYTVSYTADKDKLSGVYSLKFEDNITKYPVALPDIGFGVSQVLPILVQTIMSNKPNEILLIEQPEIHLNPRLQAELGEFFVEHVKKNLSKQFIIETHSQQLILRIKKLIRKKKISPKLISIIFVEKTKLGANIVPIEFDKHGNFINEWPDDFFDLSYKELFE